MLRMRAVAAARAATSPRTASTRVAIAFVSAVAFVTTAGLATAAHATPESQLASEQAKAEQLQSEIEANGNRVSILDEQYNRAEQAIQRTTDQLDADRAQVEAKTRETERVRSLLADRAAELYMGAGNPSPLAVLDVTSTQQLGSRSAYGAAAADEDNQLLNAAKVAIDELGLQQKSLAQARTRAQTERDALDATRREISDATARQESLLQQSNGKIKTLVDEIQAAKERAQEAAARAAMERAAQQQAVQQAAQQAAQQAQAVAARQAAAANNGSSDNGATTGTSGSAPPQAPPPQDLPAPSSHAQVAVDTAEAQLGKPYVYAASGPDSFDCSGLTMYAWAAAGVSLPHNAEAQYQSLPHVPMGALQPGDLVFYGSPIHHVGMFVGNGTMIEAPYTGVNVRYHSIYRPDFAGAARP
ncbi:MAG: peptidoglycan DL-endopeptidase CwlO [Actinomycetota bacterium]|jgi:cell wall-associated NlpC family hydrolase|nr:peptidoglycan DL-endopeptidase CwlO [Actinomycetota bacterium]